jgi:hypothetical protein
MEVLIRLALILAGIVAGMVAAVVGAVFAMILMIKKKLLWRRNER